MSKRESKKEAILLAGMEVMKAHGYNGTSVKDIVDAAKVPKGSFYNYFESKEQFALEAIDSVSGQGREHLIKVFRDSKQCAVVRLTRYFTSGVEFACDSEFRVGCFLGNMCQEMSDTSEVIRVRLDQVFKANTRAFADVIDQGQKMNRISASLDPTTTAEFLFNAWEGALMRAKASKSRAPLDAFSKMLEQILA